jgi:hypothetical protein
MTCILQSPSHRSVQDSLLFILSPCESYNFLCSNYLNVNHIIKLDTLLTIFYSFKVACALLLAGENLDNFGDVKNILVEMGTYFQVQVSNGLVFLGEMI